MTKYFLVKWQVSRLPFVEHFDGKVALVKTLVYCKENAKNLATVIHYLVKLIVKSLQPF